RLAARGVDDDDGEVRGWGAGRGEVVKRLEGIAQVGGDADVAEVLDPVDGVLVDVDADDRARVRVAGRRHRELAGVATAEDRDRPAGRSHVARGRAGRVDVVDVDRGLQRDVVGQRAPGGAVAQVGGALDLDLWASWVDVRDGLEPERGQRQRGERDDAVADC